MSLSCIVLTWNSISSKRSPLLRKKEEPPEIIQIFVKQIFIKKKNEKLIYIKPVNYKFYPHRITKLTSIKKRYLLKTKLYQKKDGTELSLVYIFLMFVYMQLDS